MLGREPLRGSLLSPFPSIHNLKPHWTRLVKDILGAILAGMHDPQHPVPGRANSEGDSRWVETEVEQGDSDASGSCSFDSAF